MGFSSSSVSAQELWLAGLVAPWHLGSSETRDQTGAPCIRRQILDHWTIRKVRALIKYKNEGARGKKNLKLQGVDMVLLNALTPRKSESSKKHHLTFRFYCW